MRLNFVIIAGPERNEPLLPHEGPAPIIFESPGQESPGGVLSATVQSLLQGVVEAVGGAEEFVSSKHRVLVCGSIYPEFSYLLGSSVDRQNWIHPVCRDYIDELRDTDESIRRCGRPLSDGEVCCMLTHHCVVSNIVKLLVRGNWDSTPNPRERYTSGQFLDIGLINEYFPEHKDEIFVILEDDARALWTLKHLPGYCISMRKTGVECSLLHGGDIGRSRKFHKGTVQSPRPLRSTKRYGTYSMAFTRKGILECVGILNRFAGKIVIPIDDLYMASRRFAVPDIPMFFHDNGLPSTIAKEREELQAAARRKAYR